MCFKCILFKIGLVWIKDIYEYYKIWYYIIVLVGWF